MPIITFLSGIIDSFHKEYFGSEDQRSTPIKKPEIKSTVNKYRENKILFTWKSTVILYLCLYLLKTCK